MGTMRKSSHRYSTGIYHVVGSAKPRTKQEANKSAEYHRERGFPSRVEKVEGGYRVFSRYQKRR